MSAPTIPETQKAIVFETCNGPLLYKDIAVPKPQANEILVNIKYSGVCHSDLHTWKNDWPAVPLKLPLVCGHEGAGVVAAVGANVSPDQWKVGDLAGIKLINKACLSCENCQQGEEPACGKLILSGFQTDGTFQQYGTVDAFQATKLPADIDLSSVGPILCAGITVYKGLKTSGAKPGQWVVISGAAGGLGSLAVQYARALGLRVIAIDGGDERGDFVKNLGAEEFIDFRKCQDIAKEIHRITDGGAHAALNVSTSEAAIQQSVDFVRNRGTVVLIGLPADSKVCLPILETVCRQISVKGSYVGNNWDTNEAIDFFARGLVKCPIKIVGLSELESVFKLMEEGKTIGRYVLDTSK
ncbi:ADH1 [Candida oxycetoniae]|uniref:alcohol dehydrogenase n=1 Tax=Candida oxycetoniae TaxID=497107 RepID=A0AAI9SU40_9ASCO|nr:ADH1 [Candida oxycetoniae]KAI3402698.1 ADH1 [Candida oxycetoniae]